MSKGWDVSELPTPKGILFIPQVIRKYGDPWWNDIDRGMPKYSARNLSRCNFVHHKSHTDWTQREPGTPRSSVSYYLCRCDCHNRLEFTESTFFFASFETFVRFKIFMEAKTMLLFCLEGGDMFIRNACMCWRVYMEPQPRRTSSPKLLFCYIANTEISNLSDLKTMTGIYKMWSSNIKSRDTFLPSVYWNSQCILSATRRFVTRLNTGHSWNKLLVPNDTSLPLILISYDLFSWINLSVPSL
jgi:hypothetical protein